MHLHEAPNEREANSKATLPTVEQMLFLDVRLKNERKELCGNADSIIPYL